jgi:hypothetical protein
MANPRDGFREPDEHIVHNILGRIGLAGQYDRQFEQIYVVLLIDLPQGLAIALLAFPDKQLIFHHPTTHLKAGL